MFEVWKYNVLGWILLGYIFKTSAVLVVSDVYPNEIYTVLTSCSFMQYIDSLLNVFCTDQYKTIYYKGGQGICVPEPEQDCFGYKYSRIVKSNTLFCIWMNTNIENSTMNMI